MKKIVCVLWLMTLCLTAFAQREKGKILNKPNIKPNQAEKDKNFNKTPKKDDEFDFEEEPKLRFLHDFEPAKSENTPIAGTPQQVEAVKDLNTAIHEDTSTVDEGQVAVVEIEEQAQFAGSDDMVKIASYYSIWDTEHINPYGINQRDFDDVIPIQLYDISQGRYWSAPLNRGQVNSHFSWRWHKQHTGTDLQLDTGDPVYAAFDGIVRVSGWQGGYGRCVVIRHYNGLETLYGHLSKTNFDPNTIVKAGDEVGLGGSTGHSTGPHLHFETRYEGVPFDSENNVFNYSPQLINIVSQEFVLTSRVYDYLRGGSSANTKDKSELEEDAPTKIFQTAWYRVRSGDTLSGIAEKFNTDVATLARLNKIRVNTHIRKGYRLRIK